MQTPKAVSPAISHGMDSVGRGGGTYSLDDLFRLAAEAQRHEVVRARLFARTEQELSTAAKVILDTFPDLPGVACCFFRAAPGQARKLRFTLSGSCTVHSCPSGGWLLKTSDRTTYWIPLPPMLRRVDTRLRILSEAAAPLTGLDSSPLGAAIDVEVHEGAHLDCAVWCLPPDAGQILEALESPRVIELQGTFMWGSHTTLRGPADVYRYLVHGFVYENRFEWRHKWKICAENEAYALYITLHGLQLATGKQLYALLKRQLLCAAISRQSQDGGWYHGEWSDFMESHYRLHNGGLLLLEAAFEEQRDATVEASLRTAAAYTARHADTTDLGLWFLHDSLEEDVELLLKSGSKLTPSRLLGKSPGTKLILNTHLDSIVALDRYRELTGDDRYADQIASARESTRALLALRPAEWLYRLVYWAVGLTLLPPTEAQRLPLPLRAARRIVREHLLPRLHRIKQRFPRMVMPRGLIDRHLSMPHYDVNYQTVNLMDLLRLRRRFPQEDLAPVIEGAISAVTDTGLLRSWMETRQRQGLGYWIEALYHLCTLESDLVYRRYLAEAILVAEDIELGLPPSLLGTNPEAVKPRDRIPCPSPADSRIRVANLSCSGKREILAVNCSGVGIALAWEGDVAGLEWKAAHGQLITKDASALTVPARSWVLGVDGRP